MGSMNKETSLLKAAWLIAFVTVISKFAGFFRDIFIANYYGAGLISDAYFYAYQIPSLAIVLMGGVGGPFHSATVSVFAKLVNPNDKMPEEKVNRLFNTFLTVTFITFSILAAIVFIFSRPIMSFIIHSNNTELINLASGHLKIMTPVIIIGGIIGIYYGLLITYRCFLLPNLSPMLMSFIIIGFILATNGEPTGRCLAVATVTGALMQFCVQIPAVRKFGYRIKPNLDIKNNEKLKNLVELVFPAALSSTVGQIYVYVDMFFASQLVAGAWTAVGYANRAFQFPVGILATAFLVPLFPIFSRLVGEKKYDEVKYYFHKGVGLLNFVAVPMMFCIILFGHDAVALVFQRGAFDASATDMVALALTFLSFAIVPYVFRDSVTRIFYSFNDSKTPFLVALSSIIIKFILNTLFISKLGIAAITLSTSLVTLINASWLGLILKRRIDLEYKSYFMNILKMLSAGLLSFAVVYFIHEMCPGSAWIVVAVKTLCLFGLYMILYTAFAYVLRIEFVGELLGRIKHAIENKFKRNGIE